MAGDRLSFGSTMRRGNAGERAVAAHYGGVLTGRGEDVPCVVCRAADMVVPIGMDLQNHVRLALPPCADVVEGDIHVEVKTDSYDPDTHPCAYLERWTERPDGTRLVGGLWRAASDGVEALAYYYPTTGLVMWLWDLPTLAARLSRGDCLVRRRGWRSITVTGRNGYSAIGRLVPRADIAALHTHAYAEEYIP